MTGHVQTVGIGLAVFLLLVLCVASVVQRIAELSLDRTSKPVAMAVALSLIPVVLVVVSVVLNVLGQLSIAGMIISMGLIAACLGRYGPPAETAAAPRTSWWPDSWTFAHSLALAWTIAMALRVLGTGPEPSPDDLSYHGPAVANWVQHGTLSAVFQTYHAYYPMNAELFALWFAFPVGSDVNMVGVGAFWALVLGAAVFAFVTALGGTRLAASGAVIVAMGQVSVAQQMATFTAHDLALAVSLLVGLLLLVVVRGERECDRRQWPGYLIAGSILGYAIGIKVSVLPPVACAVMLGVLAPEDLPPRARLQRGLMLCAGMIAAGSWWYARNLLWTGNPLYPAEIGGLSGLLPSNLVAHSKLSTWLLQGDTATRALRTWALSAIGEARPIGILSIAGLAAPWLLARNAAVRQSRIRIVDLRWLSAIACVALLSFPLMPFSGTNCSITADLRVAERMLIFPRTAGIVVLFATLTATSRVWATAVLVVVTLYAAGAQGLTFNVVALCATALLSIVMPRARVVRRGLPRAALAGLLFWLLVTATTPARSAWRLTFFEHYALGEPISQAWLAVEQIPDGARIGYLGDRAYEHYFLYGSRWQHVPVGLSEGGWPMGAPHRASSRPGDVQQGIEPSLSSATNGPGVTHAFVTRYGKGEWPEWHEYLRSAGNVRVIYDDGYTLIVEYLEAELDGRAP